MPAFTALVLAAILSADADRAAPTQDPGPQRTVGPIAAAVVTMPVPDATLEPWMLDRKIGRPRALGIMYGTLGALQALDVYSTYRSLQAGGTEINPVVKQATSSPAAVIAIKAASTAASVYFAEKTLKSNRKGAVILMAVVNGVTAAVVANNFRHARGAR